MSSVFLGNHASPRESEHTPASVKAADAHAFAIERVRVCQKDQGVPAAQTVLFLHIYVMYMYYAHVYIYMIEFICLLCLFVF